jgi:kinesin family protein 2/24
MILESGSSSYSTAPKISVVIRKRPLGKKEIAKGDVDIIDVRSSSTLVVKEMKYKNK